MSEREKVGSPPCPTYLGLTRELARTRDTMATYIPSENTSTIGHSPYLKEIKMEPFELSLVFIVVVGLGWLYLHFFGE